MNSEGVPAAVKGASTVGDVPAGGFGTAKRCRHVKAIGAITVRVHIECDDHDEAERKRLVLGRVVTVAERLLGIGS